ncbi:hypothetical protein CC86DRAFT_409249 [Ophiobolus disseminans]|uniref:Protein kinase domain-containing protein n=1 Tax=Ophiobolus disseminans TaxID=1469910 RepID=A0A6A6ZQE8_9PLEO|nr:hypothetical protein CC86DRAFT_409249 [Ophiobolus disseminans]
MGRRDVRSPDSSSNVNGQYNPENATDGATTMTTVRAGTEERQHKEPSDGSRAAGKRPPVSLIEEASHELSQIHAAGHHRLPASTTVKKLESLESRLSKVLLEDPESFASEDEFMMSLHRAEIWEKLGVYDMADSFYRMAFPFLYDYPMAPEDINDLHTYLLNIPKDYHSFALVKWITFSAQNQRNLDQAEHLLRSIPWILTATPAVRFHDADQCMLLLCTMQVLNAQGSYDESAKYHPIMVALYGNVMDEVSLRLFEYERTITNAGLGLQSKACKGFVISLAQSAIKDGLWHRRTLETLYHFGKTLKNWGHEEVAMTVLAECCRGTFYRFGRLHPLSTRVYTEFCRCKGAHEHKQDLWRFGDPDYSEKRRRLLAYEHTYLRTIVDILEPIPDVDYDSLQEALHQGFASVPSLRRGLSYCRTIARCACLIEQDFAEDILKDLFSHQSERTGWNLILESLEEIIIHYKTGSKDAAAKLTKKLLANMESLPTAEYKARRIRAVHNRLTSLNLTHFPLGVLTTEPRLISEQASETLGAGTYAVVDTVEIGDRAYARKAVALPRYRQQQIRKAIQNEIDVIRALDHPHIIRVHLTYEDKSRFFIVMEPLADCDLENFLLQQSAIPPTDAQARMICKWLICLSNTLAYIHSKGIRHKDIKPRNILVQGEEVIFADFGSSHVFLDEGDSTTEGPSFGHTKMYCAPEVINQGRRNRSTDVFSLGCVFTELVVWLSGLEISMWHDHRETVTGGVSTNSYYASLEKVETWFLDAKRKELYLLMYENVLSKVLCRNPATRITAAEVSRQTIQILKQLSTGYQKCSECRLDMWIGAESDECSGLSTSSSSTRRTDDPNDGRARAIDGQEAEDERPFAAFDNLVIAKNGYVEEKNGNIVGRVVEGNRDGLAGFVVDKYGDVMDSKGAVVGRAEPIPV